jgi:hypothetical protein
MPAVLHRQMKGLQDIALHPGFAENRLIYFTYSKPRDEKVAAATLARARFDGGSALTDVRDLLVARSALRGWKVVRIQISPELGREDAREMAEVASEGRGLPASGVVMKAEAILVAGEWLETNDGFLVDIDVEDAPLGPDSDVVVAAIGTDGGGQDIRVVGEAGTATDTTFGRVH